MPRVKRSHRKTQPLPGFDLPQSEKLQKCKDEYVRETGKSLYRTIDLARWAVATGRWDPPADLALMKCRDDFAKALRTEYIKGTDGKPVRVNHARRKETGGKQQTLWGDIHTISRDHMEASCTQQREQVVGQCSQIDRDERYFNALHPDLEPLATDFNMTDDVEENRFSGKIDDIKRGETS